MVRGGHEPDGTDLADLAEPSEKPPQGQNADGYGPKCLIGADLATLRKFEPKNIYDPLLSARESWVVRGGPDLDGTDLADLAEPRETSPQGQNADGYGLKCLIGANLATLRKFEPKKIYGPLKPYSRKRYEPPISFN